MVAAVEPGAVCGQTTMIDDAASSWRAGLPRLGLGAVRHQEPARRDEGRQAGRRPARLHTHRPRDRGDGHDQPGSPAGALLASTGRAARRGGLRGRHGPERARQGSPGSASSPRPSATSPSSWSTECPATATRPDGRAASPPTFTMTVAGRVRGVAVPDPPTTVAPGHGPRSTATLDAVHRDPQTAITDAKARAASGPRFAATPPSSCSWTCPTPVAEAGPAHPRTRLPSRSPRCRPSSTITRSSTSSTSARSRAASRLAPRPVRLWRGSADTAVSARRGRPLTEVLQPRPAATWKPVELSVTQRHDLIEVWTAMFTDVYVHYTQKRALYGFDPIRALAHCAARSPISTPRTSFVSSSCSSTGSATSTPSSTSTPRRPTSRRTSPHCPSSSRPMAPTAHPLTSSRRSPTMSSTPTSPSALGSRPGTASPSGGTVDLYAETLTGGRPDARRARALETLTQRPLQYLPPPDELWVDVGYRLPADPENEPDRSIRFEWRAIEPAKAVTADDLIVLRTRRAIDATSEAARRARKLLLRHRALGPGWR